MMYSALAVANAFLELAERDDKQLSNMQLQKLVYIAHGFNLALLGEPLFYNNVHAWEWGPVIPKLYKLLRKYGAGLVTDKLQLPEEEQPVDPASREMSIINNVWTAYGKFTGAKLSAMTHREGSPWSKVWQEKQYAVIPTEIIAENYQQLLNGKTENP